MVRDPRALRGVGLAVPTSIPRYTSIESIDRISAPSASATCSPASVLPDAVGPTRPGTAPPQTGAATGTTSPVR